MSNSVLASIKKDSIRRIFASICSLGKTSRAAIATSTDLSLMTVGKVVDEFLELDVVCEQKEIKSVAGRKAGLVELNKNKFALVIDLTDKNFKMAVLDSALNTTDTLEYEYNNDCYCEENFCIFMKNVKIFTLRNVDMKNCMGVGLLVPGEYLEEEDKTESFSFPELSGVKIKKTAEEILKCDVCFVKNNIRSAAKSNALEFDNYRDIAISYIHIDSLISGAYLCGGEFVGSNVATAGTFGRCACSDNKPLNSIFSDKKSTAKAVDELAKIIYNLFWTVSPDVVIVDNKRPYSGSISDDLKKSLYCLLPIGNYKLPDIVEANAEIKHSHRGMARDIREHWLDSLIM
ncbi:MAG: ROK family protein [Clostridia bacterium]|nr:ROK family protein [Clostridia bacterium]